jgi:hypothetical protein
MATYNATQRASLRVALSGTHPECVLSGNRANWRVLVQALIRDTVGRGEYASAQRVARLETGGSKVLAKTCWGRSRARPWTSNTAPQRRRRTAPIDHHTTCERDAGLSFQETNRGGHSPSTDKIFPPGPAGDRTGSVLDTFDSDNEYCDRIYWKASMPLPEGFREINRVSVHPLPIV